MLAKCTERPASINQFHSALPTGTRGNRYMKISTGPIYDMSPSRQATFRGNFFSKGAPEQTESKLALEVYNGVFEDELYIETSHRYLISAIVAINAPSYAMT